MNFKRRRPTPATVSTVWELELRTRLAIRDHRKAFEGECGLDLRDAAAEMIGRGMSARSVALLRCYAEFVDRWDGASSELARATAEALLLWHDTGRAKLALKRFASALEKVQSTAGIPAPIACDGR